MKNWARYAWKRVNWRVGGALILWCASTHVGLTTVAAQNLRDAASVVIVTSFLAWTNRNGSRKDPHDPPKGPGFLGVRPEDREGHP